MIPLTLIQQAIYDKLRLSPAVMSTVTGVYEEVPPGTKMPYLYMEGARLQPTDRLSEPAATVRIPLHSWDDYKGSARIHLVEAAIRQTLHRQPLTVTGARILQVVVEESMIMPEQELRHLVMEVVVWAE